MALRVLTGILATSEKNGNVTIHFFPHEVIGNDARGLELEAVGANARFESRPGKIVSIRQFHFFDSDTVWGTQDSRERFKIDDSDWDRDHLIISWSSEGSSRIQEISYLIVGDA